ncbi:MAG: hypothetical protein LDL50_05135 [Chloroflexi bacterium]|nr:hypothetical protein [Chloroflexota bacterium]MCA2001397.1 hypothetical protein [Chloroflexota bacterium]
MKQRLLPILLLLAISAAAYLPHAVRLTYYKDDWYYVYDGMIGGAKVFHEMFRIDRPARGFFFEWFFTLFGANPLPWHIGAFVWRGAAAVAAWSLFGILWKGERKFAFFAALFFAVYPGYSWWVSAIEYQPMMASLALQVFSIALTWQSLLSRNRIEKAVCVAASLLTGWAYIALVDYAIGMEAFRLLGVFLLINRGGERNLWKGILNALRALGWGLLIPLGFAFWRLFFFENQRAATDIGAQLGALAENPASTAVNWLLQIYNSLVNLAVQAWLSQFPVFLQGMRLRDLAAGVFLAAGALLPLALFEKRIEDASGFDRDRLRSEALTLGGLGMFFGVLPVVMANRYVNIGGFSHYGLPASLAAGLFMAAVLDMISMKKARSVLLYVLLSFAILAHYGIAIRALQEQRALQEFWWQVSWRAPAIREGTTLALHYPLPGLGDDDFGVMEAANLVYFPNPTGQIPVHYPLAGLTLNERTLPDILNAPPVRETKYRSHTITFDYDNLLVISQPAPYSCAHVMDGSQPLISTLDPLEAALAAPRSKIETVILNAAAAIPPQTVYGDEPAHEWCYYFQKADLAAQSGDWERVVSLGEEALRLKFSPDDRVEWMPFLKAYALTGRAEQLETTAKRVIGEKALRLQACAMLSGIEEPLTPEVREVIAVAYCKTKAQ